MSAQGLMGGFSSFGRVAVALALCGVLVDQPLLAEAAVSRTGTAPAQKSPAQIQGEERILHALNRFTFGPRPGDVEAVQAMGLKKWFEQQLNPASIDDSALDARLAQYPAMNLTIAQLMAKYPSPQMIREMMNGKLGLPRDPQQRLLAQDQIALYKIQKAKQEQAKAADAAPPAMQPGDNPAQAKNDPAAAGQMALDDADDQASANDHTARHEEFLKLAAMPPDERYQTILGLTPQQLIELRRGAKPAEQGALVAGMNPQQKETLLALGGSGRMIGLEETESRLERDIYSNRQLEAVMTDFWLNHFNVYIRKNQNAPFLIPTYERETIRPRALGNFEDLLVATAMSPAMLEYLDNARSIGPNSVQAERARQRQMRFPNAAKGASDGLNENYGRELMELHTLGVNGGYTQADVTNVAKVLTGWTIAKPGQNGSEGFTFIFDEAKHEPGSKQVLGQTIHEDSYKEGLKVLHMLATSPATAHFISQKLAVRFVSDDPPQALVDRMAATFLSSNGNIKAVLATMWNSPEFWSPEVYRAKVKTPEEFVVSAVRASGADVTNPGALVQALNKLGMPLYGMQTPQGYSWKQDDWVSTGALVSRMNFALVLAGDRVPGTRIAWNGVLGAPAAGFKPASYDTADPAQAKEKRLELALVGQPVSDRTRAAVLSQANDASVTAQAETQFDLRAGGKGRGIYRQQAAAVGGNAAPDDAQAAVMAGLLLGSPEFQRR